MKTTNNQWSHISQHQIADRLNITSQSVVRSFKRLIANGVLNESEIATELVGKTRVLYRFTFQQAQIIECNLSAKAIRRMVIEHNTNWY